MSKLNVNSIGPQSGETVSVSGSMTLTGDLTAQNYIVSSSVTNVVIAAVSGSTAFGDSLDDTHIYTGSLQLTGSLTASKFSGDGSGITNVAYSNVVSRPTLISGSAQISSAISGSFNKGFEFEGKISGSSTSTGSFGRVEASTYAGVESFSDGTATLISGSATSTGSFGSVETAGNITIPGTNKIFLDGGGDTYIQESSGNVVDFYVGGSNALKIGAQSVEIPRYFAHMGDTNNYIDFTTDTQTFVTDGGNTLELLSNHNVVASQGDIIATSGNISGSITSTGSFGRVEATTIGGNSPLTIESDNFNVRADGTISGSANSTASFGKAKFDRTVAIGDQALNAIGNYTLWVEDHDNGNGIYATDQSFFDNMKIYNDFFLNQESAYATIKVSANNRGLLLDASYGGGYTGDIFHRATGHRFFPKGSVTKGEELFVITGSHFQSSSVMLSGSATSTASFGRVEATTIGGNSPLTIESDNFNVKSDGTISGSANSTASFGKGRFDRTVAIGDQALNAIGNYTLWVEDHDNGNGIYATDQSFFDNVKIYNNFFLGEQTGYATLKVSANNQGLLLDPSYNGGYTGDIFHRATGHRFFPRGSVTKGEELFVITGSHHTSASVMLSGSATSTGSFGRVEATTFAGDGAALTNVPDYVYEPTYELRTINDLEDFVTEKKHLPNVPDMNDMDKWKSLSVGDRDMLLLEKIEELSLYIIELNKRIEKLENN